MRGAPSPQPGLPGAPRARQPAAGVGWAEAPGEVEFGGGRKKESAMGGRPAEGDPARTEGGREWGPRSRTGAPPRGEESGQTEAQRGDRDGVTKGERTDIESRGWGLNGGTDGQKTRRRGNAQKDKGRNAERDRRGRVEKIPEDGWGNGGDRGGGGKGQRERKRSKGAGEGGTTGQEG